MIEQIIERKCRRCKRPESVVKMTNYDKGWCTECRNAYQRGRYKKDNARMVAHARTYMKAYRERDWAHYKYPLLVAASRKRNIAVLFTKEEFKQWFEKQKPIACRYCKLSRAELEAMGISISLDRLENNGPYRLDNIAIACLCCNKIKLDVLTDADMLVIGPIVRARLLARQAAALPRLGSQTSGHVTRSGHGGFASASGFVPAARV